MPSKKHSSDIEQLLTEQTAVILEAVDERLQQTRMPLIQAAIGAMYGRPLGKIAVGFQELDGSGLQTVVYNRRQIGAAEQRFRALGETVRQLSKPQRKI